MLSSLVRGAVPLVALLLAFAPTAEAQAPYRKIGELELSLLGISAVPDPANPVVPKNTASAVNVVVRAGATDLDTDGVARFLGGAFQVEAELAGPGLNGMVTLRSDGSSPLQLPLPPLPVAGDYAISNLRVVPEQGAVLDVSPRNIPLLVIDQILVTSVKTRALSL